MKKVMMRGKEKNARFRGMPSKFEYNQWYHFTLPMDPLYFIINKGSRTVSLYDYIGQKKPAYTFSKKRFLNEIIFWVKSPPTKVQQEDIDDLLQ